MPNWCNNFAVIRNEDPEKIKRLADAFDAGQFCDAVIPVPEDLKITAGFLGDGDEQRKLEEQTKANVEKHGYGNWYDFCVNRWGTKWDFGGDGYLAERVDDNEITITFDSAWAPPMGIWEELDAQGFKVDAMYYESGMAYCGRYTSESGDNSWELGGMTSDQVADEIDSEIDECFGISETMREYEEENEEDLHKFVREGGEKLGLKTL